MQEPTTNTTRRTAGETISAGLRRLLGKDAFAGASSESTKMAVALRRSGKPVYQGTVDQAVVRRRRAANKRARVARRVHRSHR